MRDLNPGGQADAQAAHTVLRRTQQVACHGVGTSTPLPRAGTVYVEAVTGSQGTAQLAPSPGAGASSFAALFPPFGDNGS